MVCPRCVLAVEQTLTKLNIPFIEVKLGEAIIETEISDDSLLDKELKSIGFELINNQKSIVSKQIKALIIDFIHFSNAKDLKTNFSDFLSEKLNKDYQSLSRLFSENEDITIEKYIILQKIEKVKELISYNEMSFSEIAFKLNYSSAAHLSKQFKDITNMTLSDFKKLKIKNRITLDNLR